MKRYRFLKLLLLIIPYSLIGFTLTVGYDDAQPFHYTGPDGQLIGSDIEILREIAQINKWDLVFLELPWERTLIRVEDGRVDVAIGAKYTDERNGFAYYSTSYKSIQHWLYTRENELERLESLEMFFHLGNRKLGIMRGWGYPPEISDLIGDPEYSHNIIPVNNVDQLPGLIDMKRIDAMIFTPQTLKEWLASNELNHALIPRAKYEEKLYYLLSRKSVPQYVVEDFNRALDNMITSGKVNEILDKYR